MADRHSSSVRTSTSGKALLLVAILAVLAAGLCVLLLWGGPEPAPLPSNPVEATRGAENGRATSSAETSPSSSSTSDVREVVTKPAAFAWSIRVLDREKRGPVSNARVRLSAGDWHVEGSSGADGSLALRAEDRPELREADLLVDHPSFVPARVPSVRAGETRDVLLVRSGEISGRCQPVPGSVASVLLFEQVSENSMNWPVLRTDSDEQGVFRYTQLAPGDYALTARVDGWRAPTLVSVRVQGGETREVILALTLESVLRGRLLSAESQVPIADAKVSISVAEPQTIRLDVTSTQETATKSDGRFEFHGLPAVQNALVFRPRDVPAFRRSLAVSRAGEHIEQDFLAPPTFHIRGRMVDLDKNPVADMILALVGEPDWQEITTKGFLNFKEDGHGVTHSRADGTFDISAQVDPGNTLYILYRRSRSDTDDIGWSWRQTFVPRDGTELALNDVVVGRVRTIAGIVNDERGAPVANATIEVRRTYLDQGLSSATSGENGVFSIPAPDLGGQMVLGLRLTARRDGFSSDRVAVDKPSPDPVVLVLHPVRTVIARAIDVEGRAVPNILLVLGTNLTDHRRGPRVGGGGVGGRAAEFGRVGVEGVVCMESEIGIDSKVQTEWQIESREPAAIPAEGDREVLVVVRRVDSPERATIRGRLVKSPSLDALNSLRIEALPAKPDSNEVEMNAFPSGSNRRGILERQGDAFTLSNVQPGRIFLLVHCRDCGAVQRALDLRPGETLDVGDVEIARAAQLRMRFFDANNLPVTKVKFEMYTLGNRAEALTPIDLGADFLVENALCGRSYEVRVTREGRPDHVQRVDVPNETRFQVTVRLD